MVGLPVGVSERQKPQVSLAQCAIALACGILEAGPVENCDRSSPLRNQALVLENAGRFAHGRALNTQHLSEELVGEWDFGATCSIRRTDDPSATT